MAVPRKPNGNLSDKPSAVRARLRNTARNAERDMEMLYEKPVSEWDMDELAKGRPRSSDGTFRGPAPSWITPLIMKEAQDRLRTLTRQDLSSYAADAIKVMGKLMKEDGTDLDGKPLVPPTVRLNAAQYVLDQLIGKPTNPVEISGNVALQTLMATVLVNDESGAHAHPVIEGEVVDDDEDTPKGE